MTKRTAVAAALFVVAAVMSAAGPAAAQGATVPFASVSPAPGTESVARSDGLASREQLVSDLLRTWSAGPGLSSEQLATALRRASTEQLVAASKADSFDAVSRVLALVRPSALGSPTQDYVYTAVTPCRIFDTRNAGGGGPIPAGGTRDFYVYGTADVSGQGGNPAGCPSPRGEPRAVHLNLAAVPVSSPGNLRVYPANIATPTASAVNFASGNIANALTVQTYYAIGPKDIQVFASNTANVVADVLGYFYDADLTLGSGQTLTGQFATGVRASAVGDYMWASFSFPLRLASAPAAPSANFIVSNASTTACPGSTASPAAAAGQLCVYVSSSNCTGNLGAIFNAGTGQAYGGSTAGGSIYFTAQAAGNNWCYGTWAVTAP